MLHKHIARHTKRYVGHVTKYLYERDTLFATIAVFVFLIAIGMIKLNVFHKIKLISKWTITILIACTYILISCRSNKQKSKIKEVSQSTVVLKGQKDRYSISCKLLGIDDLRTNKELPKIRIWISFSLYDTGKIINIKYDAGTWLAEFYQYRFGLNDNNESILISKNKVESTPHSGWNDFFNQIEKLGIYTLNDNDRRHNSGLCTDANNITVEIVKHNNVMRFSRNFILFGINDVLNSKTGIFYGINF